jgi:copper chaperone CopZ
MNPDPSDSIPHEYIDAEISVTGLNGPADEKTLTDALGKLQGVQDVSLSNGKVLLEYEPVQITKAEIEKAIVQAGFQVSEVETGQASAITDALHGG